MKIKDMIGRRFGRLVVVEFSHCKRNGAHWKCVCECGGICVSRGVDIRNGKIKSCGCARTESSANNGRNNKTHGLSRTRLYDVWKQMMNRCYKTNCKDYKNYGARGITVLDSWQDLKTFWSWAIESGYSKDLTIERKDVNKGYCPDNCCWIRNEKQAQNTRRTKRLTFLGKTHVLSEWAKITGLSRYTIIGRFNKGWTPSDILTIKPIIGRNQYASNASTTN